MITDKKKIICRLCKTVIAYSDNTSNLAYHLQRTHPRELKELRKDTEVDKACPSSNTVVTKQLTFPGTIVRATPFPRDGMKHKQLVDAVADFICLGLKPLSVVDDTSFRHLLETAELRFQLPHRTHFTDIVIPAKYRTVRANVEKQLTTIEKCTITSDLWTAQYQQRAYISLIVHFVDNDFNLESKCLQIQEIPQNHDASSLKEVLDSMLKDWSISEKVCGGITDNAGNIVNAIGLLGIEHFPCVAHTLQLSIKNGLTVSRVQRVLGRCKMLVEQFKKSTKETYKLREKQEMLKLPQHKIV